MAIQTRIVEAEYDSDSSSAGINYACIEIYDDAHTSEYEGDEGIVRLIKFDFTSEFVRVGSIKKEYISQLSSLLSTYEGATKDQLTLPTLRHSTEYKNSSGNTTRLVEYYTY